MCGWICAAYLVVVKSVHERNEPPGLSLFVQREQRNVTDKESVEQPGHLQVVTGP